MAKENTSITQWLDAAGRMPILPKQEVHRLAVIIQDPNSTESSKKKAINKLVVHNMKLVPSIVRRCMSSKKSFNFGDDFTEDLLQSGAMGLFRAANKFDPKRGYCFSTYASSWIFQAIQREIYNNMSLIRIPENTIRDLYHSIDKSQDLSFSDSPKIKRERLLDAFNATQVRSMSSMTSNRDDLPGFDLDSISQSSKIEFANSRQELNPNEPIASDSFDDIIKLASLSQDQVKVLNFYFVSNLSYKQIGNKMGMGESVVYGLAKSALATLNEVVSW